MGFLSSLFSRASRMARAQADPRLDALDDSGFEASVRKAVADMRAQLNEVVRASAEAMSTHNRLEADYRHHRREADQWRDRAREALGAGDEGSARKAVARKQECERRIEAIEPSLSSARQASETLRAQVARLRLRIEDAERNASTLIARRNAAEAQKKLAQTMAGAAEDDSAFAALGALEETVTRAEAEAQVHHELSPVGDDDLERQLGALGTSDLDTELETLRREAGIEALPAREPKHRENREKG